MVSSRMKILAWLRRYLWAGGWGRRERGAMLFGFFTALTWQNEKIPCRLTKTVW